MTAGTRGRPSLYREEFAEQARKPCLLGATDQELADFWGIAVSTLYLWKRDHAEFSEATIRGKILADAEVASKLFERAIGYQHGATKLYRNEDGTVNRVEYQVHHAPDTQAASLWLRNRRKQDWRERHEFEARVDDESLLDRYTEEQLITRLMQRRQSKAARDQAKPEGRPH